MVSVDKSPPDFLGEIFPNLKHLIVECATQEFVSLALVSIDRTQIESLTIPPDCMDLIAEFITGGCPKLRVLTVVPSPRTQSVQYKATKLIKALTVSRPPLENLGILIHPEDESLVSPLALALSPHLKMMRISGFSNLSVLMGNLPLDSRNLAESFRSKFGLLPPNRFRLNNNNDTIWKCLIHVDKSALHLDLFDLCHSFNEDDKTTQESLQAMLIALDLVKSISNEEIMWALSHLERLVASLKRDVDQEKVKLILGCIVLIPVSAVSLEPLKRLCEQIRSVSSELLWPPNAAQFFVNMLKLDSAWICSQVNLNGIILGNKPLAFHLLDRPRELEALVANGIIDPVPAIDQRKCPLIFTILEKARYCFDGVEFEPLFRLVAEKYKSTGLEKIFKLASRSALEFVFSNVSFRDALIDAFGEDWACLLTPTAIEFAYRDDEMLKGFVETLQKHQERYRHKISQESLSEISDRIWETMIASTEDDDVIRYIDNILRHFPVLPERIDQFVKGKVKLETKTPIKTIRARIKRAVDRKGK